MGPIMLTLPRRLRNLFAKLNILLVGIVLGNERKEAKKLDPTLEVLVDELLEVSSLTSMMLFRWSLQGYTASILLHVLDYRKVLGVVGSGSAQECTFCSLEGERSEVHQKTVYLQNRHFFPRHLL